MSKPILDRALTVARENPWLQQFGQSGDASTAQGALGCTHTCLQFLTLLWFGDRMTHDEISHLAGYPWPDHNPSRRGMYNTEVETFARAVGLPYAWRYDLTSSAICQRSNLAPVMLGVAYKDWPAAKSMGTPPRNGFRNGNASRYGADQPYGFDGGHAALMLGFQIAQDGTLVYGKDPNHGSVNRPKTPDYDTMTTAQLARAVYSWKSLHPGGYTYAFVPTKRLEAL